MITADKEGKMDSRERLIETIETWDSKKRSTVDRIMATISPKVFWEELADSILSAGFIHKSEAVKYCEVKFFPKEGVSPYVEIKLKEESKP